MRRDGRHFEVVLLADRHASHRELLAADSSNRFRRAVAITRTPDGGVALPNGSALAFSRREAPLQMLRQFVHFGEEERCLHVARHH
jgi:hypothetical protein